MSTGMIVCLHFVLKIKNFRLELLHSLFKCFNSDE